MDILILNKIDIPTPEQYFKQILTGETQQQSFLLGNATAYTSNEEILSVFNREIIGYNGRRIFKIHKIIIRIFFSSSWKSGYY